MGLPHEEQVLTQALLSMPSLPLPGCSSVSSRVPPALI